MEAKWMRQMSLRAAEICELAAQRFSGQPERVAELLATAADLFAARGFHVSKRTVERDLLKLNNDTGGVQARKVIDRLMAEEQAARAAGAVVA